MIESGANCSTRGETSVASVLAFGFQLSGLRRMILNKFLATTAVVAVLATPFSALAQTPRELNDLLGMRGSSLENEMQRNGYNFVSNQGEAQYWWNRDSRQCVAVTIANGRVDTLNSQAASQCGHSENGNGGSVAGLAAGAVAVGLVAALTHHHRDNNSRNNPAHNSEYERGYNDAMYGSNYSNNDSEGYHSGYMAGETERQNRRHANSTFVRGAPQAAQTACKERGDEYWGVQAGSTVPVGVFNYDNGTVEITVASGHHRASCTVNRRGNITGFAE